jgi:hypothetical protein
VSYWQGLKEMTDATREQHDQKIEAKLSHNTTLTIGVFVILIGGVSWLIRSNMSTEFELKMVRLEIKQEIGQVNARLDSTADGRWSSHDMQKWAYEMRKANPTIVVPEPDVP